jgi:xylulokinase
MILSIDLGSTSFKAAVFDRRLKEVSVGRQRLNHRFGKGGHVELDVATVERTVRGALTAAGVGKQEIRSIALTSQAQTFTVLDGRGRALRPFISWQDRRAGTACDELIKLLPDFGEHGSFGDLSPALQLCQLRNLGLGAGVRPVSLPSYVLMLLTGEIATDNNIAAMSGLYSMPLKGWWPAALRGCGLREQQLARVIPVGTAAAETSGAARRFGLRAGIPVILAGNDQTAGGYAARLETRNAVLITLGTAQVAYACCRRLPKARPGTIRGPYPGGLFYRMAADGCGGNVVNWAETVLAGCHVDAGFFKEAQRAPRGCHGLVFDSNLDAGAGGWKNIGLHHTRADLARSILESLSARMAGLVDQLGVPMKGRKVLAAGGGSAQPVWRKIVEEVVGVELIRTTADPLLGAARMAVEQGPAV